jgi:hypothetical protein
LIVSPTLSLLSSLFISFKRERVISDVLFVLQFGKSKLAFLDIFEWPPYSPELRFATHLPGSSPTD